MSIVKILVGLCIAYICVVIGFESLLGYFQPAYPATLSMTTTDDEGISRNRVLEKLEVDGKIYVAVNHWPRAWYHRALANPLVTVSFDNATNDYDAVQVDGAEYEKVNAATRLPLLFKVLTGFPPRYILRLDPVDQSNQADRR